MSLRIPAAKDHGKRPATAVGLARQVREGGVTALRLSDVPARPYPADGLFDIMTGEIVGVGMSAGRG
jgi:hypothetical protein